LNCQLDDPDARVHVGRKSKGGGQYSHYGKPKETQWYTILNNVVADYQKHHGGRWYTDHYVAYNAYFGEPKGFDDLRLALEHYVETNQGEDCD
tara:strand:+ start:2036 stop:2314 length:279 start_codon:yes stop_codon:yes gene_type:complete